MNLFAANEALMTDEDTIKYFTRFCDSIEIVGLKQLSKDEPLLQKNKDKIPDSLGCSDVEKNIMSRFHYRFLGFFDTLTPENAFKAIKNFLDTAVKLKKIDLSAI